MDQQSFEIHFREKQAQRLDHFLVTSLPQYSRSRLQALIRGGHVRINGASASKAGQLLEPGSAVRVEVPATAPTSVRAEYIPLDVIFENEDVIVVNKPAGLVVHPGAGHPDGTLVNAALAHDPGMEGVGGEERPGIIHRLDKDTSGLILLAKNDRALHALQDQFTSRSVQKTYIALVDGRPPTPSGRIEAPIGRDMGHRQRMAITAEGKGRLAVSEYRTLEAFPAHTLLEVHPSTGRTHQIRLHLAFIGCPIVGDTVYGRKNRSLDIHRHFLHALRLVATLPGEAEPRQFMAPLSGELEEILEGLRAGGAKTASIHGRQTNNGLH